MKTTMSRTLHISIEEYRRLVDLGRIQPIPELEAQQPHFFQHPRAGKSTAGKRTDLGGQFFRSKLEANYARVLTYMGTCWEYESRIFEFPIKRGVREYRPDFYLPERGEYHEVKGWLDPRSKTALTRFAKYYPNEKLVLIPKSFFDNLRREGIPSLIPNWE